MNCTCGKPMVVEREMTQTGTGAKAKVWRCSCRRRWFLVGQSAPKIGINQLPKER